MVLTSETIPAVRARLATGGVWHSEFQQWVRWADDYYSRAASASQFDSSYVPLNYAFIYATYPVPGISYSRTGPEYGLKARELLLRVPSLWQAPPNEWMIPLAYDWVWPLLTPADKQILVPWFKTAYLGNSKHPFNTQVVMAWSSLLMSGIATAGDGIDDAWSQSQVANYATWFESQSGITRAESDLVGEDGGYAEGDSYAFAYSYGPIIVAEEAWRTANGRSRLSHYAPAEKSVIRRIPLHVANTILPWATPSSSSPGGRKYVFWKSHYQSAAVKAAEPAHQAWMVGAVGVMKDVDPEMAGLGQWLIDNRVGRLPAGETAYIRNWVWKFMLGDAASSKSPDALNLPKSRRTRDGRFIFRTGWDNVNDSYVTITFSEWLRGITSPQYPGGFTVDRMGPQVIRQGGMSGHDPGKFSVGPNNILTFPDRSIAAPTHPSYDDTGGQRVVGGPIDGSQSFVQNGPNDLLDEVRYLPADPSEGRDVDYVYGDITRAYSSTRFRDNYNPARVSEVVRQFLYIRPPAPGTGSDVVIVFDRSTTTDTKFSKEWLFHTSGDPMVDGTELAGQPVRGGTGAGKWTYTGATRITATNTAAGSNGRTFLTPLLPATRRVVKVGGPNAAGEFWQPDSREFEGPYGEIRQRAGVPDTETEQYIGRYRIEISPTIPALSDVFLNVIEVTHSTATSPIPAKTLPSTGLVAARIGNRVVAFNRITAAVASGSLSIDEGGVIRFHFADLTPGGEYELTFGASKVVRLASSAGTLNLEESVQSGAVVALRATGVIVPPASPPSAPFPPSNVRIIGGGGF